MFLQAYVCETCSSFKRVRLPWVGQCGCGGSVIKAMERPSIKGGGGALAAWGQRLQQGLSSEAFHIITSKLSVALSVINTRLTYPKPGPFSPFRFRHSRPPGDLSDLRLAWSGHRVTHYGGVRISRSGFRECDPVWCRGHFWDPLLGTGHRDTGCVGFITRGTPDSGGP